MPDRLYAQGLVSIDTGSDAKLIVGNGTLWATAVVPGDTFEQGGIKVTIAEVTDDTHIVLAYDWPGSDLDDVAYVIRQDALSRLTAGNLSQVVSDLVDRLRIYDWSRPLFSVKEFGVNSPPGGAVVNDIYVVGTSPTGAFDGHNNDIAIKTETGWLFRTPEHGWHIDSEVDGAATNIVRAYDGTDWVSGSALALVPVFKGTWSGATAYKSGNIVVRSGALYIATADSTNLAPETHSSEWSSLGRIGVDGAGVSLQYVFKTSTTSTVADTSGQMNANAALGSTPTIVRVNPVDVYGTNWATLLGALNSASTSTIKGRLRITVIGDYTKQFTADVTGVTIFGGHWNFAILNPLPFGTIADGSSVLVNFAAKGDKGDIGQTGGTGATGARGPHGGPHAIPLTFSTTTADADPGAGAVRLDNATQENATTIRIDLQSSGGQDITDILDYLANATGTPKAIAALRKSDDPDAAWIEFAVTALATPSGYRNWTIEVIGSSASNPFANDAAVVLSWTPVYKGDTGATGSTGAAGANGTSFTPQEVVSTLSERADFDAGPALTDGVRLSVLVESDESHSGQSTLYFLLEADTGSGATWSQGVEFAVSSDADNIAYDNGVSGLAAGNVQAAIDELAAITNPLEQPESSIASAATTDIGSLNTVRALITGTTGITSFGTQANKLRIVRFAAAVALTHNATSLILLGRSNRTTVADAIGIYSSDGSGNWSELYYADPADSPAHGAEAALASASTTNLGSVAARRIQITGTTTITSFGSAANQFKLIRFAGALTLTHNGTSLILPGGESIVTAAGDTAIAASDGSGNWRVYNYTPAAAAPAVGTPYVILATGQSNMSHEDTLGVAWSPPRNLKVWNGTPASAGTAFATPDSAKMNVAWSYAAEVARANPGRPVRLVLIAASGLAIANWLPGAPTTDMYAGCKAAVEAAIANLGVTTIDELLWWQGESDAASPSPTGYPANFESVIDRFVAETWFPLSTPTVIFGLSPTAIAGDTKYDSLSITLAGLAALYPLHRTFVPVRSIPSGMWDDATHLTAEGYELAGKLAFNAVQRSCLPCATFVTLTDDTAVSFTPPSVNGSVDISIVGALTGNASFDFNGTTMARTNVGTAATTGTSALSGTTGTDGKANYATALNRIYVENRLAITRTFRIIWRNIQNDD